MISATRLLRYERLKFTTDCHEEKHNIQMTKQNINSEEVYDYENMIFYMYQQQ